MIGEQEARERELGPFRGIVFALAFTAVGGLICLAGLLLALLTLRG